MIAIDLTPAGKVVTAGSMATLGGEKLLEKGLTVLESRFISDIETKSTQIISEDGRKFIIDDVAKRTALHAEKHINDIKYPEFSLSKIGIKNLKDLEKYIKETLEKAPKNPDRYEIASDIRNDRLAIWDKRDQTMTVFNPKGNNDDAGFGTIYKPQKGYNAFLQQAGKLMQ